MMGSFKAIVCALLLASVTAFVPESSRASKVSLKQPTFGFPGTSLDNNNEKSFQLPEEKSMMKVAGGMMTSMAVVLTQSPLMALAEEEEYYEYGAVNAPIGIAVGGGILAILTALLPVFMTSGEEAFEEMKGRDFERASDALKKRQDRR